MMRFLSAIARVRSRSNTLPTMCSLVVAVSIGVAMPVLAAAPGCTDGFDHDACVAAGDPGSAPSPERPDSSGGNPISLLTGNKHQRETDHAVAGRALVYERHYNSVRADHDIGLGQGWSDTYSVRLTASGDRWRIVEQSNGRRIGFESSGERGADGASLRWRASRPSDGEVHRDEDGRHRWRLPDGRTLHFVGSYLVRIDFVDGKNLSLHYRQRRLASVTDDHGRVLRFEYTPGDTVLAVFDEGDGIALPGHLAAIVRPDGTRVRYAYDNARNLVAARFPDGTARHYHYEDPLWRNQLTGITDRRGVRTNTWRYDESGRAAESVLADGREHLLLQHGEPDPSSGLGETTAVTATGARSVWHWRERDGERDLLASTGDGCRSCPTTGGRHAYDEHGLLAATIERGGHGTITRRDTLGRVIERRRTFRAGEETSLETREWSGDSHRLAVVRRPSVRPGHDRETHRTYDADGNLVTVTERGFAPVLDPASDPEQIDGWRPIERITQLVRERGRVVAIDGPMVGDADRWRLVRDERGELRTLHAPDGRRITIEARDESSRVTRFRINDEPPITLERDGEGRVARIGHRGLALGIEHDAEGHVVAIIGPWGRRQTFEHDGNGRLSALVDDVGRRVEQRHDGDGHLIEREAFGADGAFVAAATLYRDLAGEIESIVQRTAGTDGTVQEFVTRLERDEAGAALGLVGGDRRLDVERDERNALVAVARPDGTRDSLERDADGRVVAYTDPAGNVTRFRRDDFGRIVARHDPDTGPVHFRYADGGDGWTTRLAADGTRTTRRHDGAGRIIEERFPDDTLRASYDPETGRLLSVANEATVERFAWSAAGDLVRHEREIDGRHFVTNYTHDSHGRLASRALPNGPTLRYHYHASGPNVGRLRAVTRTSLFGLRQETLVGEIDLDPRDGSTGHVAHNGLRTTHRFAPNGELTGIDVERAMRLRYRYDAAGAIVTIDRDGTLERYRHGSGRLIEALTGDGVYRYAWDVTGNRTEKAFDGVGGTSHVRALGYPTTGDGNRLVSASGRNSAAERDRPHASSPLPGSATVIPNDRGGRPAISAAGHRLDWNDRGRLARVRSAEGRVLAEYAYNGFGERVKKSVPNANGTRITYFLYDGHTLSAEIDTASDAIRHYVYVADRPVALIDEDETHALHGDHLGTVRLATDEDGAASWRATIEPFGTARVTLARIHQPLRLPGQYADDESGLHYNRHRYLDPETGRYLTPDPAGLAGGTNAYAYASGSPLDRADPFGLSDRGGPTRPDSRHPAKPIADQDFTERLMTTLGMVADFGNLPDQVAAAIREQLKPETLAATAAVVGLFVALQATPLGPFVDAVMVGLMWWEFGSAALDLVTGLIDLVGALRDPGADRASLCSAADRLSRRITSIVGELAAGAGWFGAANATKGAQKGAELFRKLFSSNRDDALAARPRPCPRSRDSDGCGIGTPDVVRTRTEEALDREVRDDWERRMEGQKRPITPDWATSKAVAVDKDGSVFTGDSTRVNIAPEMKDMYDTGLLSSRHGSDTYTITNVDAYVDRVKEMYRGTEPRQLLHPRTEKFLRDYLESRPSFSKKDSAPGLHAEVQALNDIFHAAPDIPLDRITLSTYKLTPGAEPPALVACANCSGIVPAEVRIQTGRITDR